MSSFISDPNITLIEKLKRLYEGEKKFGFVLQNVSKVAIFSYNLDGEIRFWNKGCEVLYGYKKEEILGKNVFELFGIKKRDFDKENVCLSGKNGNKITLLSTQIEVKNESEEEEKFCFCFDITKKIDDQKYLEKLANYDQLTSLPNRHLFEDRLSHAIANCERDGKQLMLMLLDIDNFKSINDTLGHSVGDLLLKSVADRLKKSLRKSDTVARLGGDFFVILFENIEDYKKSLVIVENVFKLFKIPFKAGSHEVFVTVTGGIALYPDDSLDGESLLKCADIALHNAKKEDKSEFRFYNKKMNDDIIKRVKLERYLRTALERNELFLTYQPQIDIKTGKVIGVEALIRWMHPKLKMIPPLDFIPIAEDTRMILEIGKFALEKAVSQLKEWERLGIKDIKMVINVSAVQFTQGNFAKNVKDMLCKYEVNPKNFEIEITETVLMKNMERTKELLMSLKEADIGVAIDDFGTGYSSLVYLKKFPINRLKIDKTFIDDIPYDNDDAAITKTIISLGKTLGMKVVAEGVENRKQLDFLMKEDCDEVQGYIFSKPLLPDQFVTFMRQYDFEKAILESFQKEKGIKSSFLGV